MPAITGCWTMLSQGDFEMPHPNGGYLHFREQFRDVAQTQPITYLDPLTKEDTGKTAREFIQEQAAVRGWPLIGIYISGWGQRIPHFALHRTQFPTNPAKKADRLQLELDGLLEGIYKSSYVVTDPTEPDYGQTIDVRSFWPVTHVWNYKTDHLYLPRTDYQIHISDSPPKPDWWKG